jgi:1,2-diacylglycerol 3-beta-glucosyltransferase
VLAGALELFLVSLGLTYYVATVGAGLRVIRRARKARREQAAARAGVRGPGRRRSGGRGSGPAADLAATVSVGWGRLRTRLETAEDPAPRAALVVPAEDCVVYYLIPCLNEELVIADTVRSLLADPRGLVVVVDDASDDRTGELAAAAGGDRVRVVRRELPDARRGKGPALNAGFAHLLHDAGVRGIPASRITVCVMDADGRLSEGALDVVLPLFEDPRVGGVQLPVRIRNRTSVLTVMQDLEFWGVCAVAQLGRMACGTVSLGGNGQFTRLAALLEMGPAPWRAQLTEDLDLSLALAAKGWRLTSAADAHVSQQGVTSLRALVNQRTRWYQGHMQAVHWLRELWTSRQLSHLAMLELTIYLLVPWALVLPWSIIFNYNLLIMVLWVLGWVATPGLGSDLTQKIATLAFWYTLSCLPIYMAGFLYGRQERKVGYFRAFFIGHLLLVGNYVTYVACWRAMYRLITGVHGWEKTRRTDERQAGAPAPAGPAPARPKTGVPVPAFAGSALGGPAFGATVSGGPGFAVTTSGGPGFGGSALAGAGLPDGLAAAAAAYPARPAAPARRAAAARHAAAVAQTAVLEAVTPDAGALGSLGATALLAGPAAGPDLAARVPRPRPPAGAESRAKPARDWADHDASTTNLPVITEPPGALAGLAGLAQDQPARRPSSRSGHGQSRRVAGSHRAARARPAQHSGR